MKLLSALSLALVPLLTTPGFARAQSRPGSAAPDTAPPPVMREFRAAWVATVENMDWPSRKGLSTAQQKEELLAILDRLVSLRMNAVILQVRPSADALYQSSIEPWSDVLTGEMGRAPSPFYDPLAFAVTEAHKRGLELHAWINPYRAKHPSTKTVSSGHVSRTNPKLVRKYGPYLWLDPGDPAVRALTEKVVFDIVRRYDVDGIHLDDYFYPYPETRRRREIPFPDGATWKRYKKSGGTLSRGDWRRQNVDKLVKELYEGVHEVKPWVKFGVSPFGIWRPGYPASVRGLDQYSELYADARKWLNEGWVDYFTPQLYWSVDKPQQSYVELLAWWHEQNRKRRHLWPGNYTGKVGFTNWAKWPASEVIEQIRLTRLQPGATGNVHFSMSVFMQDPDGLNERLLDESYFYPAIVPASPWLARPDFATPDVRILTDAVSGDRVIDLRLGNIGLPGAASRPSRAWLWVVQKRTSSGWTTEVLPGDRTTCLLGGGALPLDIRVLAIDRVGNASPAARIVPPL